MTMSNIYESYYSGRSASRNSVGDIGKFSMISKGFGRDSQISFNSHNSSVSNLSFRSASSPIKATKDSFDIE